MRRISSLFLILALILNGCVSRSSQSEGSIRLQNEVDEISLGNQIHAEIMSNFHVYTEPTAVNYVGRVGKTLAFKAKRQDLSYRFTTLYHDKIYATSAPGGFVYVTTGMINFLENEAELAAVLAHEIQRIQRKDKRLSKVHKAFDTVTKGGMFVAPFFGPIGALAATGLSVTHAAVNLGTPSKNKLLLKADKEALSLMVDAGYDPQGYIDVMHKFLNAEESLMPYFYDYYQARPISLDRFNSMEDEFEKLSLADMTFDTNRAQYMEMTKGIREMYK